MQCTAEIRAVVVMPSRITFFVDPSSAIAIEFYTAPPFRRLSDKTQVFTGLGDYHRTRLTHTMEVSSIARTIGRALRLNEDLIEALALLHDIGHPPFGHAGEEALDEFLRQEGGFSHNQFALTIVEELEQRYPGHSGLNLTYEVLGGQRRRVDKSAREISPLLEVQVVDLADSISYDAHDVDDAVELGWLTIEELRSLPIIATCERSVVDRFGRIQGAPLRRAIVHELINIQVVHLIHEAEQQLVEFSESSAREVCDLGLRLSNPQTAGRRKTRSRTVPSSTTVSSSRSDAGTPTGAAADHGVGRSLRRPAETHARTISRPLADARAPPCGCGVYWSDDGSFVSRYLPCCHRVVAAASSVILYIDIGGGSVLEIGNVLRIRESLANQSVSEFLIQNPSPWV